MISFYASIEATPILRCKTTLLEVRFGSPQLLRTMRGSNHPKARAAKSPKTRGNSVHISPPFLARPQVETSAASFRKSGFRALRRAQQKESGSIGTCSARCCEVGRCVCWSSISALFLKDCVTTADHSNNIMRRFA